MKRFVVPALALGMLLSGVSGIATAATSIAAATPAAVAASAGGSAATAPTSPGRPGRPGTKDPTPPGPVTALTMSGNALRTISLHWTDPAVTDLAHVMIRRAVGSQPPLSAADGTVVAVLGKRTTDFTDRHLEPGTTYSYALYAFDRAQNPSTAGTITASTLTTDGRTGLKGSLTDQAGNPISGVWAEVRFAGSGNWAGQATTAADGSYRMTNLQPGTYTVCFEVTSQTSGQSRTGYLHGCYRQQPFGYGDSGTPVTVVAGKMTSGIKDYLPVAGAIAGRITDSAGNGIANVDVYVTYPSPSFTFYSTYTSADGSYTLAGMVADTYQICFDASYATGPSSTGYLNECYDNQPQVFGGSSTPIPVTLGHTTAGIDAVLDIGAAVTGTVTDQAGNPVYGVSVGLIPAGGNGASTDAQGHYTITGAAPGIYTTCFEGDFASSASAPYGYTNDCFGGRPSFELAAGQTVTQNSTLQAAGGIGGSVAGTDGPVAGVEVNVFDSSGAQVIGTSTDENGNWQLPGFAPGTYTVCYDPSYTSGGYRRSCYHGQPDGSTTGTPVTVTAGQLTTVDDTLELGAAIAGRITDSTGAPLSGVQVDGSPMSTGGGWYYATTDQDGNYTLGGVNPGSYSVCFDASYAQGPAAGGYTSECYDNQPTVETADPVQVGDSGTITVNAQLAAGGAIAGTVTDQSNGGGIDGVSVVATSHSSGQVVYGITGEDGSYTLPGLSTGNYTVCFHPDMNTIGPPTGYVEQCWQAQTNPYGGTPVQVTEGSVTSGIDARLTVGGEVIGTVTDTGDAPVAYVSVVVQGTDGTWYDAWGFTDSSGHYSLVGLPAVPLAVCFQPPYGYQQQCYRNAPDVSSATPVTPTSGGVTNGIDAVLQPAN